MTDCSCGHTARRLLTAAGIDVDAHPTPPLIGPAPAVIGTCEHGVTWPARGEVELVAGEPPLIEHARHVPAAHLTGGHP